MAHSHEEQLLAQRFSRAVAVENRREEGNSLSILFANAADCHAAVQLMNKVFPEGLAMSYSANPDYPSMTIIQGNDAHRMMQRFGEHFHQTFVVDWAAASRDVLPERIVDEEGQPRDMQAYLAWLKSPEAKQEAPNFVAREEARYAADAALRDLKAELAKQANKN